MQNKDDYRKAAKDLVEKAQQKKSFWKGLALGLFYGIIGNVLVSHYYGVFTGLTVGPYDDLFCANVIAFSIILVVVLIVSVGWMRSIAKLDDFLKFVEDTKKKYNLDDEFDET